MSENSYLRDFSAQVSQIVFLVYFTVLRLFQLYDLKCKKTHISTISVQKYHKSCSSLIWPFYSLLQPYDLKCQKTHISAISMHKYHKSCFSLNSLFNGLLQHYDLKFSETHISTISVHKYHKSCS